MSAHRFSNKRRGWPRLTLTAACGLALISAAVDARADDQQKAEELFERGRKLMQGATTLDEACRTLEESLKLMDRGDTVLNLAECHRRQGKTATAWAEFDRALSHGSKVGFTEAIQAATQLATRSRRSSRGSPSRSRPRPPRSRTSPWRSAATPGRASAGTRPP